MGLRFLVSCDIGEGAQSLYGSGIYSMGMINTGGLNATVFMEIYTTCLAPSKSQ